MKSDQNVSGTSRLLGKPTICVRSAQPYCAITVHCGRDEIGAKVPALFDELSEWFEQHGIAPEGPPVVRYLVVDYNTGSLDIDVGLTSKTEKRPENTRIHWNAIPAGRYITAVHAGPYELLVESTAELLEWSRVNRIALDVKQRDQVKHWGCRVESYLVAPPRETRPERCRTEIAILLSKAVTDRETMNQPQSVKERETP